MCKYTYLGNYTGVLDVLLFNADVGRDIMKQPGLGRKHGKWIGPFSPQNDVKLTRRGREGDHTIRYPPIYSMVSPPFPPLGRWVTDRRRRRGGIRQSDLRSASIIQATGWCIDYIIARDQPQMCILHPIQRPACCILNYIIKLSVHQVHLTSQQPVLHLESNLTIKIGS